MSKLFQRIGTKAIKFSVDIQIIQVNLKTSFPCDISVRFQRGSHRVETKKATHLDQVSNQATLNENFNLVSTLYYEQKKQKFLEKSVIFLYQKLLNKFINQGIFIVVIHTEQAQKKGGTAKFDLSGYINSKQLEKIEFLPLQNCPDKTAGLTISFKIVKLGQIIDASLIADDVLLQNKQKVEEQQNNENSENQHKIKKSKEKSENSQQNQIYEIAKKVEKGEINQKEQDYDQNLQEEQVSRYEIQQEIPHDSQIYERGSLGNQLNKNFRSFDLNTRNDGIVKQQQKSQEVFCQQQSNSVIGDEQQGQNESEQKLQKYNIKLNQQLLNQNIQNQQPKSISTKSLLNFNVSSESGSIKLRKQKIGQSLQMENQNQKKEEGVISIQEKQIKQLEDQANINQQQFESNLQKKNEELDLSKIQVALKKKLNEKNEEIQSLNEQNCKLIKEIEQLKKQSQLWISEYEEKNYNLQQVNEELNKKLVELQIESSKQNQELATKVDTLEVKIQTIEREKQLLKNEYDAEYQNLRESFLAQNNNLQQKQYEQIQQLEKDLNYYQEKYEEMENQKNKLEYEKEQFIIQTDKMENQINMSLQEKKENEQLLNELQNAQCALVEKDKQISELQKNLNQQNQIQLNNQTEQLSELANKLKNENNYLKQYQQKYQQEMQLNQSLQNKLEELEIILRQKGEEYQLKENNIINEKNEQIDQLKNQIVDINDLNDIFKNQISELGIKDKIINDLKNQLLAMKEEYEEKLQKIQIYQRNSTQASIKDQEEFQCETENAKLSIENENLKKQLKILTQTAQFQKNNIDEIQRENNFLKYEKKLLEEQCVDLKHVKEYQEQIKSLNQDKNTLEEDLCFSRELIGDILNIAYESGGTISQKLTNLMITKKKK